jgi:ribonuclease G
MAKELIINQTLSENRVALIENGEILDFLLDRGEKGEEERAVVGNIYKGKVLRVLPGMQSAFVDIGLEKAAFLYVDDAYIPTLEEQRELVQKSKQLKEKEFKSDTGEVIPDEMSTLYESVDMRLRKDIQIDTFLREGDELLVQIAKEPISTKGPRITRHVTLAGRHIVFMPFIEHTGVSRRIENEEERSRLKEILDTVRSEGQGIIARTVAEGQSAKILRSDFNMLVKIWKDIVKKSERMKAPSLVYRDMTFIHRVLRDITDEDVDSIVVDGQENYKQVEKFAAKYLPSLRFKLKLYTDDTPIFEHYGIDIEIERAMSNKIYLKSGGHIHVDQTEALVSVDVNTGKYVGKKTLEETIVKTNLEAVKEISYQLRLRNCGGIIIIDFIDMEKEEHKQAVYQSLLEALKKDRAKTNVLPISALGLVEMTRKRTRETLTRVMCHICPYCEGTGRVKSALTVCHEMIRELHKVLRKAEGKKVYIYAHPEVSALLCGDELGIIETLEECFSKTLIIRSEYNYHIEQYEIFSQNDDPSDSIASE